MQYRTLNCAVIFTAMLTIATAAFTAPVDNLIFNSGFELGSNGYGCVKYLRLENNPAMKYDGIEIDRTTAASGKQSLRIPNRFAEHFRIFGNELQLKAGAEYTFSFACKSSAPETAISIALLSVSHEAGWHVGGGKFKPGEKWQRYNFSFKVPAGRNPAYYSVMISTELDMEPELKPGDIWIDDLMLTEGKETQYQPFQGIEAIAATPPLLLQGQDKTGEIRTLIINNTAKPQKMKLRLEMVADHGGNFQEPSYGNKKLLHESEITLAAGEKKELKTPQPMDQLGSFEIIPSISGVNQVKTISGFTAIAGKYDRKPIDLDRTFCVGLNHGGAGGFIQSPAYSEVSKKSYRTAIGMDEYLQMMSDMGCRIFRDLDYPAPVFRWNQIEKQPGKMDFRFVDMTVDSAAKYGITILPILGEFQERYIPSWCYDKRTPAIDYPGRMKDLKGKIFMPPMDLWRNYVRSLAEHFKGRIHHFEIANEPNLYLDPKDYMTVLKVAAEELKAADPKNKVIGFCSTGDLGGSLSNYLEDCFKLGGLQYADIASFHPYSAPHINSLVPADKLDAELELLVKKYKKDGAPLWNTEIYYLTGKGRNYAEKGFYSPADAAQRFLTDLGEGISQSICVPGETVFRNPWSPHNHAPLVIAMAYPNANYVAYNALARFFEGAKPIEKIRWGNDSICYVYEKDGKYLAALWNYSNMKELKITFNLNNEQAGLYDVYGNQLSLKKQPVPLNGVPYYLKCTGDKKDFVQALRNATIEADKPVMAGEHARILPDNGSWKAVISLKNCTNTLMKGEAGIQAPGMVGAKIITFEIAAGKTENVSIPVILNNNTDPVSATVKVYVNEKLWEFPVALFSRPKIYNVNSTSGKNESLRKNNGKETAQHQAEFSASSDGINMQLIISVKDNSPSASAEGRNLWEQDCLELFFDTQPGFLPEKYASAYHDYVGRIFIVPYANNGSQLTFISKKLLKLTAENIRYQLEIKPDGYVITLSIPLEALSIPGKSPSRIIGFDLAVDNAIGAEKATQQLLWNSTGDAYKNRGSFGILEFTK